MGEFFGYEEGSAGDTSAERSPKVDQVCKSITTPENSKLSLPECERRAVRL